MCNPTEYFCKASSEVSGGETDWKSVGKAQLKRYVGGVIQKKQQD